MAFDSPLFALIAQARQHGSDVLEHGVEIGGRRLGERLVNVQVAPLAETRGWVVVSLDDLTLVTRIDRQLSHRGAARSVTGMAAVLAHEVKNPLAGIRGAAQLLEQTPAVMIASSRASFVTSPTVCAGSSNRSTCLATGRRYAAPSTFTRSSRARAGSRKRASPAAYAFTRVTIPSLPPALANGDELIQVFLNLIKNAAEAVPHDDGEIELSTAFRPGVRLETQSHAGRVSLPLEVGVRDNGSGIPDDIAAHLFDPFVTNKVGGTGLGLAMVAKIVDDHGGVIEFDSTPEGCEFASACPYATRRRRKRERNGLNQATILIADDDRSIRTVLEKALRRIGYAVRSTGEAATLWQWIDAGEGDLVLTDVVMPDGNGLDLLPRIKRVRPDLPIVIMSAQTTLLTAIRATERGAYEYLPKPFDLDDLARVIERSLDERDRPAAASPAQPAGGAEAIPLIGRSPAMQEVYRLVARLTGTELTVLITGESGTGKELVARALHDYSKRRGPAFRRRQYGGHSA